MFRRLAPVIAATMLIAACGGDDDGSVSNGTATTDTTTESGAAAGTEAPSAPANPDANPALQFTAAQVGGGQIDVSELGDKPVLFWFWAPW